MKYLKTTFSLTAVCIVMALALAVLNHYLGPIIEENNNNKLSETLSNMYEFDSIDPVITIDYESNSIRVVEEYVLRIDGVIVANVYLVEGLNGYSNGTPTKILAGFNNEGVITAISLVSISQTKDPSVIGSFGSEYISQPTSYEYVVGSTDTYAGVTFGAIMMNDMIKLAKLVNAGGNE